VSDASAASAELQTLLQLQELDVTIDQLQYRRNNLTAHATMADVQHRAGELRPELAQATVARDEVAARQRSLESEVESIESRVATINTRLYGDSPVASKDAQAMTDEVKHLADRKSALEDDELELMEAIEPLAAEVARLETQAHALAEEMQTAQAAIAAGQAEIDAELAQHDPRRQALVGQVPGALLTEYNRLRSSLGGVAVARITGNQCGGCHLTISPSEMDRIRKSPPDAVVHCEECGRMLVR
jgi:uncharacterized protein